MLINHEIPEQHLYILHHKINIERLSNDLLESGAKINQARNSGATPLYIASQEGHI